jgi:hypothetical protein
MVMLTLGSTRAHTYTCTFACTHTHMGAHVYICIRALYITYIHRMHTHTDVPPPLHSSATDRCQSRSGHLIWPILGQTDRHLAMGPPYLAEVKTKVRNAVSRISGLGHRMPSASETVLLHCFWRHCSHLEYVLCAWLPAVCSIPNSLLLQL